MQEALPSLATGLVRVRGEHLDAATLIQAVEQAGYNLVPCGALFSIHQVMAEVP